MTVTSGRRLLYAPAFIGLLVTNFVLGLTSAFVVPFGSLWATQEVGMSPGMLGLFMTLNSLSAILVSTLVGRWSDSHVTRRTLLLIGAGAGALGYVGYAYIHDPILLTVIGSTAIALASLSFAQLFAHVREELGRHEGADATFLMGVLRACFSLAWAVGPNMGASIKGRFGYFGLFWTTTLFFLALLVFVLLFVAHRPHTADIRPAVSGGAAWGLGEPRVLAHCVAFGLLFAAFTLNSLNLPLAPDSSSSHRRSVCQIPCATGSSIEGCRVKVWIRKEVVACHRVDQCEVGEKYRLPTSGNILSPPVAEVHIPLLLHERLTPHIRTIRRKRNHMNPLDVLWIRAKICCMIYLILE